MPNYGELEYLTMLRRIMLNGSVKTDRTGVGTRSLFGYQLRFDMAEGFPLMTTKEVDFKNIAVELLWFLSGSTNIKPLVDQDCNIWNDWPLKRFNQWRTENSTTIVSKADFIEKIKKDKFKFAEQWGELGPVYGKQWRRWFACTGEDNRSPIEFEYVDQIAKSIEMLKKTPDSRRNIVSAWNVADIDEMAISGLPPCHFAFQWNTRLLSIQERTEFYFKNSIDAVMDRDQEAARGIVLDKTERVGPLAKTANLNLLNAPVHKLDCHLNIRSWDTFLGGPYNIASYALLLHMYAQVVNMVPGELIISSGDTHIYSSHFNQVQEQMNRTPTKFPTLILDKTVKDIDKFILDSFTITEYNPQAAIRAPIAV